MAGLSTSLDVRQTYAADVSGLVMVPDAVARPSSAAEVAELLAEANAAHTPVTACGSQTSTTGASISDRGIALSLRNMTQIIELDASARSVRVEPGVLLGDLRRTCAEHGLLFTPDPTSEEECTVGGAIACNASGARSLRYGATRPHVQALTVVMADGSTAQFRRTKVEKNTVGYAMAHDPSDWFVGSEGTLGVVVEAEFSLLPMPDQVIGLAVPFVNEHAALSFVVAARESDVLHPRCLEYFDNLALVIARAAGDPNWAMGASAFVYVEEAPGNGTDVSLDEWLALAERHSAIVDDVAVYEGEKALADARRIRHAIPTHMNERGNARRPHGGRKVSTDWAVPYQHLDRAIARARELAEHAGIEQAVIYGHAGNGHPHQNFIAEDADHLAKIDAVVEATLREIIALGGTVAAEHGIGKLKRKWLPLQMSPLQMSVMRSIKRELDPHGILAPGNIL